MAVLMNRIFRKGSRMTVLSETGTYCCRGVITGSGRKSRVNYSPRAAGRISCDPYILWCDTLVRKGDYISYGSCDYLVLRAEKVSAFGTDICVRAELERMV